MDDKMIEGIKKDVNPREYSSNALAYLGDGIFEVYVRDMLVKKGNMQVYKYHKDAKKYVKASSQAKIYFKIKEELTDDEIRIFKRGRNANSTTPKNASVSDYKNATGLEALIGYLYLDKKYKRIRELIMKGIKDE